MTKPESAFADYTVLTLPDLSSNRRPPDVKEIVSIPVHPDATEDVLLLALARCLGAYCAASDVILGFCPTACDRNTDGRALTAVRIKWENAKNWQEALQGMEKIDTIDDSENVMHDLGIEVHARHSPFLAIVAADPEYDHALVATLHSRDLHNKHRGFSLRYSTRILHKSSAFILASQTRQVLEHVLDFPSSNPKELDFLDRQLLSTIPLRKEDSLYDHMPQIQFVTDAVNLHDPSARALEFYEVLERDEAKEHIARCISYGELRKRSNRFAAYLRSMGVEMEDRVALCMSRSIEFHVAMLGALKAGTCYVPIDPDLPRERKEFIVKDSGSKLVFKDDNITQHIRASESFPDDDINLAKLDGLAYLLYTSGTTGNPKGCLLTHDSFSHAILALSYFPNQAGPSKHCWPQAGRYLAVASIAFDVHLGETFVTFALGMTLISAPRSQLLEDLANWISRFHVTHLGIVPSLLEATMLAINKSHSPQNESRGSAGMDLAFIASGGEKISDSILERWADHPTIMLANFYGPSEVTIGCSACIVSSRTRKENIGRVFKQCSVYVVDENLNLVMRGCAGELLIGGRLVGRGYHNRPNLARKAFIYCNGERLYRTGDLVRLMPDDTLEILGRIDTQIKLHGVRIESEGISAILRNAAIEFCGPSSKDTIDVATVLARHPRLQADQLVSFIAFDTRVQVNNRRSMKPQILQNMVTGLMNQLKLACTDELASYMRPAYIIPLTFLPLNANGKADSRSLVKLFESQNLETIVSAVRSAFQPGEKAMDPLPRQQLTIDEAKVADVAALYTLVPREILTPYSDLFEIGFDSMKLVRFASKLRKVFGPKGLLTIGNLMRYSTIREITNVIQGYNSQDCEHNVRLTNFHEFEKKWNEEAITVTGINRIETILPTFPMQDGVLYRSAGIPTLYIQHLILRLHEEIDIERLRSAWGALFAGREILRTVFHFSSSVLQIVLKAESCNLPWEERKFEHGSNSEFSLLFMRTDAIELARDINENISSFPPFRLVLYHIQNEAPLYLVFSIHHALFDGVSLPQLLRDVEALYLAKELSSSVALKNVLEDISRIDLDRAARFWSRRFEGFDWTKISQRLASGEEAVSVSYTLQDSLIEWEKRAAQRRVSLNTLFTTSFGISLDKYLYGSGDVAFGVIRSGRTFLDEELNQAQAPLLSILPTRVRLADSNEMLKNIQHDMGEALAFEHLSLGRIQQWIQPGRNLFEVLFSISIMEELPTEILSVLCSSQPQADYILSVEIILNRQTGAVCIECAFTTYFTREIINDLLRSIESTAVTLGSNQYMAVHSSIKDVAETIYSTAVEDFGDECDVFVDVDQELEEKIGRRVLQFLNLKDDEITPTSSLVSLGLDSIRSIGLSRALRQDGLKVTALELMRHPHIRYIAAQQGRQEDAFSVEMESEERVLLEGARSNIMKYADGKVTPFDCRDNADLYPATTMQSGMLSQTVSSGGNLYVHAFSLRLSRSIDVSRLKRAWQQAAEILSILRTTFHYIPEIDSWIQAIHSSTMMHWDEVELTDENPSSRNLHQRIDPLQFSSEECFSIPPVRLHLCHESRISMHVLTLIIHHALYDGISISKLLDIISSLYSGQDIQPAPQFTDILGYFQYQEQYGTDYWINLLRGFRRSSLGCTENAANRLPSSASCNIPLPSSALARACKSFNVTAQCFGQAAFAKVLATLCECRDVTFGHVVSGRNVKNAEDVLGPMINTLPCRVQIPQGFKNIDLVRMIHRNNLSAQKWQHASLRTIQRNIGKGSIWDSIFIFQPAVNGEEREDKIWSFGPEETEVGNVQYALNIELHQHSDYFIVKGACRTNIFSEGTLNEFLIHFATALESIINNALQLALPALPCDNEIIHDKLGSFTSVVDSRQDTLDRSDVILSDPRTRSFIEILAACLRVSPSDIMPETPLVSLGVDSISSIRISAKAREAGLNVHAADILRCYSPSDLPEILKLKLLEGQTQATPKKTDPVTPELYKSLLQRIDATPTSIDGIAPATAGMRWLVGMWQLSGRTRFQHAFAFELEKNVDEERLKAAWCKLVNINPILRSTFAAVDSSELYVISYKRLSDDRLWLSCKADSDIITGGTVLREAVVCDGIFCSQGEHISGKANDDDVTDTVVLSDVLKRIVSKPLSTKLPPIRAFFVSCGGYKHFILHLHHFHYDAWSLRLLIRDLRRLYSGEDAVNVQPLPAVLHDAISLASKEEQKQYWSSYLPAPFKPCLFPKLTERMTPERLVYAKHKVIDDVLACRGRARKLCLNLNAVFIACWARVQAEFSRTHSATFGLWHMGRTGLTSNDVELALPMMNVLPIHVDDVKYPLREITRQIQATLGERTAVIQQTRLEDLNSWTGSDCRRKLLNVFLNIVVDEHLEPNAGGQAATIMGPLRVPYFIPKIVEDDLQPTSPRLDICDFIEEAILIDLIVDGSDVTVCVEYTDDHFDSLRCQELVIEWGRLVYETLEV